MIIRKEPYSVADLTMHQKIEMDYWQDRVAKVLRAASMCGVVITVSNPPNQPPAMGNYDLVVSARVKRGS